LVDSSLDLQFNQEVESRELIKEFWLFRSTVCFTWFQLHLDSYRPLYSFYRGLDAHGWKSRGLLLTFSKILRGGGGGGMLLRQNLKEGTIFFVSWGRVVCHPPFSPHPCASRSCQMSVSYDKQQINSMSFLLKFLVKSYLKCKQFEFEYVHNK